MPRWWGSGFCLGAHKEAYGAGLITIMSGVHQRQEQGRSFTIFTDFQEAICEEATARRTPARPGRGERDHRAGLHITGTGQYHHHQMGSRPQGGRGQWVSRPICEVGSGVRNPRPERPNGSSMQNTPLFGIYSMHEIGWHCRVHICSKKGCWESLSFS